MRRCRFRVVGSAKGTSVQGAFPSRWRGREVRDAVMSGLVKVLRVRTRNYYFAMYWEGESLFAREAGPRPEWAAARGGLRNDYLVRIRVKGGAVGGAWFL